jgi:hypothetical protein
MIGEIPLNDPRNYIGTGSLCHEWERHIGDLICAKNIPRLGMICCNQNPVTTRA